MATFIAAVVKFFTIVTLPTAAAATAWNYVVASILLSVASKALGVRGVDADGTRWEVVND